MKSHPDCPGFTLVELSIVLVIIGLIVGGILVGQSLIAAAGVRATISQIEKYNTAVNAFRGKYGGLPGDLADPPASSFGFIARGQYAGEGDGNGVIQGNDNCTSNNVDGYAEACGETVVFWRDLSTAGLIDSGFVTATENSYPIGGGFSGASLNLYFPQAKLGNGNYIYVYSGGLSTSGGLGSSQGFNNGLNYFGIAAITAIGSGYMQESSAGLTPAQALGIDSKIDDGLPQSGNVTATYNFFDRIIWVAGVGDYGASTLFQGAGNPTTAATPGSSTTCYDNSTAASGTPGVAGAAQHYSVEISDNINCAVSFKFQ